MFVCGYTFYVVCRLRGFLDLVSGRRLHVECGPWTLVQPPAARPYNGPYTKTRISKTKKVGKSITERLVTKLLHCHLADLMMQSAATKSFLMTCRLQLKDSHFHPNLARCPAWRCTFESTYPSFSVRRWEKKDENEKQLHNRMMKSHGKVLQKKGKRDL